jgi:hypothetical protein
MSDIRVNRWLHQSGTGGVYQDSTGRVGIGTSVPTSALDVQSGTIKIGNNTLSSSGVSTFTSVTATTVSATSVVVSAGTTAAPSISPSGDSNTGIFFPSADTVCIGEGGSEVIRVDSSGNVGIGTNNLLAKLAVHYTQTSSDGVRLYDIGNNTVTLLGTTSSSYNYAGVTGHNSILYSARNLAITADGANNGTISMMTGNNPRLIVDSSGRITRPYQPAFLAYRNTTLSVSATWQNISSGILAESYDVGSVYSTSTFGRFVAPVAGKYMFYAGGWSGGSANGERYAFGVKINNTGSPDFLTGGNYSITDSPLAPFQVVLNLAANDYIELWFFSAISTTIGGSPHVLYWGGYLLG